MLQWSYPTNLHARLVSRYNKIFFLSIKNQLAGPLWDLREPWSKIMTVFKMFNLFWLSYPWMVCYFYISQRSDTALYCKHYLIKIVKLCINIKLWGDSAGYLRIFVIKILLIFFLLMFYISLSIRNVMVGHLKISS